MRGFLEVSSCLSGHWHSSQGSPSYVLRSASELVGRDTALCWRRLWSSSVGGSPEAGRGDTVVLVA
jgi:hypothetical protein